jgi:pimeloyl-ACP methyl ester carboxylesterase
MSLIGRLQSYDEDERLCFLEVEVTAAKECVIFISGLRGNFLTPNYLVELSKYFTDRGIAFVQIQLRSHPHFGLYTLNDDCDDMEKLIALLKHKYSKFILFGHSTGCQDIVHFLKTKEYSLISRCFL